MPEQNRSAIKSVFPKESEQKFKTWMEIRLKGK